MSTICRSASRPALSQVNETVNRLPATQALRRPTPPPTSARKQEAVRVTDRGEPPQCPSVWGQ